MLSRLCSRRLLQRSIPRWGQVQNTRAWQGQEQLDHPRQFSILRDFKKKLKVEVDRNPELKKSVSALKEKAETIQNRTKETTEQAGQAMRELMKKFEAVKFEAEAKAKQMSATVKDKVTEATQQVKEKTTTMKAEAKLGEERAAAEGSQRTFEGDQAKGSPGAQSETSGSTASSSDKAGGDSSQSESSTSGRQSGAGFGGGFSEQAKKGYEAAKDAASSGWTKIRDAKVIGTVKQGLTFVTEELTSTKPRRQRTRTPAPAYAGGAAPEGNSDVTAVVIHQKKRAEGWRGRLEEFIEQAQNHPAFDRLRGVKRHPVFVKGQEIKEELRDRWETSDHPVVHKIQDINESIFGETATGAAMREIRRRDPGFLLDDFVLEVQQDIRGVLEAYRKGNLEFLKQKCSSEVIQRCTAELRSLEYQGLFVENKILHISDIEVKETKLLGKEPVIILTFQTQQTICARDRAGKIIEGGKDDILTVFYAWAMQQCSTEDMPIDETHPRWQLREMQQLARQAIV